jgi:serine/threonine protein phosphatase PrpC
MKSHEFASGVLQGADHRYIRTNCQDAVRVFSRTLHDKLWGNNTVVVGVCADGCGTGEHTEVGAQLGVNIATDVISTEYLSAASLGNEVDWNTIKDDIVARVGNIAQSVWSLEQDYNALIIEYFFFTIIGFAMTSEETTFFRAGDGVLIVNGEDIPIKTPDGNRPEYLGYNLLSSSIRPDIEILFKIPTDKIDHFLLGSDGLKDICAAEEKLIPKKQVGTRIPKEELVGPLSQFWTGDQYFDDPQAVRRRLMMFNGGLCADARAGIARDDTSLVVCRRRNSEP